MKSVIKIKTRGWPGGGGGGTRDILVNMREHETQGTGVILQYTISPLPRVHKYLLNVGLCLTPGN